jgi:hypothetical protein
VDDFEHFSFDNMTLSNGVPEPASWVLMIGGIALAGAASRRCKALMALSQTFGSGFREPRRREAAGFFVGAD